MVKLVAHERPARPAAILPPTQVSGLIAWLAFVAAALVGGLGSWVAVARLETAVIAPGTVEVDGRLRTVQHLEGGLVEEILVRDGQRVAEGDVLLRLDGTRVRAQLGILRSQHAEALAREARLTAEYEGAGRLTVGPDLARLIELEPSLADIVEAQRALLASTREADRGEIQILQQRAARLSRERDEIASARATIERQLEIVRGDLVGLDRLNAEGLVPRQRYSQRLEDLARLEGALAANADQDAQIDRDLAASDEQIAQIDRDRRRSIAAERQEVRGILLDLGERLLATEDLERRLEIRAPTSGRIIGLAVTTVGEVIAEGATVLQIVPADTDFVVAAQVAPDDIDEVRIGGEARVRFSAYSMRTTTPVIGTVREISADRIVQTETGRAYYAIEVTLDPTSLAHATGIELMPGMAGQVMVRTGSETVLSYLIDPLLRGLETAMTESY